jgi:cobaltochelatase CobN
MHLLAAQPGAVSDGSEAVDLGQSPGDIVILSAAESELACLAAAQRRLTERHGESQPSLRLASLLQLGHHMSVDLYAESVLEQAKLIVVRLLGGQSYWPYGLDQALEIARRTGAKLAVLPGDDQPDPVLTGFCTLPAADCHRLWQYCVHGGVENSVELLNFAASLLGVERDWREPAPLLKAGLYETSAEAAPEAPAAAILFYRSLVQAGNTGVIDALCSALADEGLRPVPVFAASLRDPVAGGIVESLLGETRPDIILNATGFAVSTPGAPTAASPLDVTDCPVLQVVFAGSNEEGWRASPNGLGARDIAMNVALPEVDGRVLSRAVSFKSAAERDALTETDIVSYRPVPDRVAFVARLAAKWVGLRRKSAAERRIGLVVANYPNRDGRIGNGVGLDTPAAAASAIARLRSEGYDCVGAPESGRELVDRLLAGPTNDFADLATRTITSTLPIETYVRFLSSLDPAVRKAVEDRWGTPEGDPFFLADRKAFAISAYVCGNLAIGLQPARGYNIDPKESYHDPALVPPHGYLAFYAWLREDFGADAIIHMGKHGNMEWLPGKSLALSSECFPEAVFGPLPHLYPFIVNDPGEGTQAKRRSQAVIVDHLTPPLTRAESYGPLRELERLVDEYYEAANVDPRRLKELGREIVELSERSGLDLDCGIEAADGPDERLQKLDNHLCELKELQIRDGLHVFGQSPGGRQRRDLLVALTRVPRGDGSGAGASILRALTADLGLGFDPLDCAMADAWAGPRPDVLESLSDEPWRTNGDTVERLEMLAAALVGGEMECPAGATATRAVLDAIADGIAPAIDACGEAELDGLLRGLDGRFVAPGPSGAPTRGRPEVLPTGRNFYSVDTRTVPTPTAWRLGWKSAGLLVERYVQDHGDWPRAMAVSAWGTSNMRTGGDDIAQVLALMGVQPQWETGSGRVTGFEIIPADVLGRPRVDVTLRISGFFRDAFPGLIDLVDSAARAVAALDEPASVNPLAAASREAESRLLAEGHDADAARRQSAFRVFGSKPGAYGAGLQAMIDERLWETDADLAAAYVEWGGYAYGAGAGGEAAHDRFRDTLSRVEAVVQNQDNREHDLLDSDDYYQFEGGMNAAVRTLSGAAPTAYHPDHSRPESPRIRSLEEEIARIVRARVVNPKWISGVMRHGYKGAFEMAATVDYLFAFAATARAVRDHQFDLVFDAYLDDAEVHGFLERENPDALREMAARLREAIDRGLWRPRRNAVYDRLGGLMEETGP